MNGMLGGKPN